jgi:tripartite-type tricarboxylate transporter receptor subunit TctC
MGVAVLSRSIIGGAILGVLAALPVAADPVEDFYKGKNLRLTVGSGPGSGFTIYARLMSRHFARHVPGKPTILVENIPGAGGLRQMDYLVAAAPKDGSTIGLMNPNVATANLLTPDIAKHGPEKLAWIGSANAEVSTCLFWPRAKVNDVADLKTRELAMGAAGPLSSSSHGTLALSKLFGYPWKVVSGYTDSSEVMLAGARGEIDGACILLVSAMQAQYWEPFQRGEFNVLLQMPPGNHPSLPKAVNATDLASSDEQRQVIEMIYGHWAFGRPFAAPEGIPQDRLAALRAALKATLADPEFLAEGKKLGLDVDYMTAEQIEAWIAKTQATPAQVIDQVKALMPSAK